MKIKIKVPKKEPSWFANWFSTTFGNEAVFSPLDVARRLKRHPAFVYRAIRTAELEAFRLGKRSYVIPRDALKKWLLEYNIINVEDI